MKTSRIIKILLGILMLGITCLLALIFSPVIAKEISEGKEETLGV